MSKKTAERKVLRVGIVQDGRIVEERILKKERKVSIGQSPKNTFAIPISRLPAAYTLFEQKGGRYTLRFVRGMEGRLSLQKRVADLKMLVDEKLARRVGDHYYYPLTEFSRGRIVLGDVTLLFQFVTPPPPVSTLQLPAVVKVNWWKRIDGIFASILLVSLLLQGGAVGGLEWWWTTTGQFLTPRPRKSAMLSTLKTEVSERVDEEDEPATEKELLDEVEEASTDAEGEGGFEPGEDEVAEEDLLAPKKDPLPTPKVRREAREKGDEGGDPKARYTRKLADVRRTTLIRYIVSDGAGPGSGLANTLDKGVAAKRLADAFGTDGGVTPARPGERLAYDPVPKAVAEGEGGTKGYRKITGEGKYSDEIKTGKVAKTGDKGTEVKVRPRVRGSLQGGGGAGGRIDKAGVASVFRRRSSAIRRCYEAALRGNPNVTGKVTIRFTIGPAGRITGISVTANSTGDSSIGSCIVSRVKGWRFDPPERGSVTFSYPFILSKGGG